MAITGCLPSAKSTAKPAFTVRYEPATDPANQEIEQLWRRRRFLEGLAERGSALLELPRTVTVIGSECDKPTANYAIGEALITFCYQNTTFFRQLFADTGDDATDRALDAGQQVFFHEVGHAADDLLELAVTGEEEDVADSFSALALIGQGETGTQPLIAGVAALAKVSTDLPPEMAPPEVDQGYVRFLFKRRAINLGCLAYGFDDQRFAEAAGEQTGLTQAEMGICPYDYSKVAKAWTSLLGSNLKKPFADP